jgi:hypothetical protein
LTEVLPPVLTPGATCEVPLPFAAVLEDVDVPLSAEQPTSTAAAAIRPIPPTRTRFLAIPIELSLRFRVAPMAPS